MVEVSSVVGRLNILDYPIALPAHCGMCGISGSERKYLDLRLDFEDYGALIFCKDCVMSMAQMFGFIEPDQARELEARVEEAERELIQSRSLLANLGSLRVSLDALGIGDGASVDVSSDPVDKPDEGLADKDSGESDQVSDSEQPDSDQYVDESRPDDSSEPKSVKPTDIFSL